MIDHKTKTDYLHILEVDQNLVLLPWKIALFNLAIYIVCRFIFLLQNWTILSPELSPTNFLLANLQGVRFDLSMIITLQAIFLLLGLVPWYLICKFFKTTAVSTILTNVIIWGSTLIQIPFIILQLIDIGYFEFTGRRLTVHILMLSGELADQSSHLVLSYWYLILSGAFFIGLTIFLNFKIVRNWKTNLKDKDKAFKTIPTVKKTYHLWFMKAGLFFLAILIARGGWQVRPLAPAHTYTDFTGPVAALALNTPTTLLRSESNTVVKNMNWLNLAEHKKLGASNNLEIINKSKPNIVILIMESFGLSFMEYPFSSKSWIPNFEKKAKEGLFFVNHFANGRRSIDAIPSIFGGMPNLMDRPFIFSPFTTNQVKGLGTYLKTLGYRNLFFHGASTGSMHFDAMTKMYGIDEYFGREDYDGPDSDDDGGWGIFDIPFFLFAAKKLDASSKPFFATVFGLSSHNPYTVPKEFQYLEKGSLPIHQSLLYSDLAIQKFFEYAEKQPWYQDTIFILTADHTATTENPILNTEVGRFRVPLVIFSPSGKVNTGIETKVSQHADLPATLLHIIGETTMAESWPFSKSLISDSTKGEALFFSGGHYYRISNNSATAINLTGTHTFNPNPALIVDPKNPAARPKLEKQPEQLKAAISEHHYRLLENRLTH